MRPVFISSFADEMNSYLDDKKAAGYTEESFQSKLKAFDRFCAETGNSGKIFTSEQAQKWMERKPNESTTTHYGRVNAAKQFLLYLRLKGYDVVVVRDVKFHPTQFQPYIYSDDEVKRFFAVVDSYYSSRNRKDAIQYPILFRILYSCGTRISETLYIQKRDVDLVRGIIRLIETKNGEERFIALGEDLQNLMRKFADKCFYLLAADDYIFTNAYGGRLDVKSVYEKHRLFLTRAGIPYRGNGEGPRIHDWRHSMAVRSFKQLADAGFDLYVALPILSAYLGHKTIYATEHYVRLTMQIYPSIERKFAPVVDRIFGGADEGN